MLHLGNTLAFAAAWLSVRSARGRLLLRIEDVDVGRARDDVSATIRDDLRWLGLDWDTEVAPQSTRDYAPWLARLPTYRCTCPRAVVAGGPYPGTCRDAGHTDGAWRFRVPDGVVRFVDRRCGARDVDPRTLGDPVVRRRDGVYAYNLAVVADDLADGVTEVVRGEDLLDQTAVQVRLWEALGGAPPTWSHTPLVLGPDGKKLSKSHGALGIGALRAAGVSPAAVWRRVLPWLGLPAFERIEDAIGRFDPAAAPPGPIRIDKDGLGFDDGTGRSPGPNRAS